MVACPDTIAFPIAAVITAPRPLGTTNATNMPATRTTNEFLTIFSNLEDFLLTSSSIESLTIPISFMVSDTLTHTICSPFNISPCASILILFRKISI